MLLFYNDVVNGQNVTTVPRWIGIEGVSDTLSKTRSALSEIAEEAEKVSTSDDPWIETDPPAFEKKLSEAYNSYRTSSLPRPNPASSQNGGVTTIVPLYVQEYGNYTQSGTILNIIYKEYSTKISASIQFLNQAKGAASSIGTYESQIQDQLQSAQENINTFSSTFDTVESTFDGIVDIVNFQIKILDGKN
jgi:hypothetical protein